MNRKNGQNQLAIEDDKKDSNKEGIYARERSNAQQLDQAPKRVDECYVEGCEELAEFTCRAVYCCKNYGCGRRMCRAHKTKKILVTKHGGTLDKGSGIDVCIECESKACWGGALYCIPTILMFALLLGFIIFANIMYKRRSPEELATDHDGIGI